MSHVVGISVRSTGCRFVKCADIDLRPQVIACTIGLPIFLPIAIISAVLVIFNALIISGLLVISPPGRSRLIEPFVDGILRDEVGQKLLLKKYARPSAVELAQLAVPRTPWVQLLLCLFMDFICGNASYLVPLLGDSTLTSPSKI